MMSPLRIVIAFLIFAFITSCNYENDKKIPEHKKDSVVIIDSLLHFRNVLKTVTDTLPEFQPFKISLINDQGEYIHAKGEDSSYSLSTIYFPDGRFQAIYLRYLKKNMEVETAFYFDGKVRHQGTLVQNSTTQIGKWNYYSAKGKLDSVVDFDEKLKINYGDAIRIAEERGWKEADYTIYGINYTTGFSWQIIHTEKPYKEKTIPHWKILEINSETGKQKITNQDYLVTVT